LKRWQVGGELWRTFCSTVVVVVVLRAFQCEFEVLIFKFEKKIDEHINIISSHNILVPLGIV
jgi:hypothetical protein